MNPITQLRLEQQLTQAQCAKNAGLNSQQAWDALEKNWPNIQVRSNSTIARGLGITVANLYHDVHDLEGLNFAYDSGVRASESANGLMWAKVEPETDARRKLRAWFNAGKRGEDRPAR